MPSAIVVRTNGTANNHVRPGMGWGKAVRVLCARYAIRKERF